MKMPRVSASVRKPLKEAIVKIAARMGVSESTMVALLLDEAVSARKVPRTRKPSDL